MTHGINPISGALPIEPLRHPPNATIRVPGSKSITNRAPARGCSTLLRVSRSCHPRFDAVALASGYAVTGPRDPLPPRTRGGPRASAAGRFGGMPASAKMGPSRSCMKRSYASADSQTSVIRAPSSVIDSMWAIWPSGTLPGPAPSRYTRPSSCSRVILACRV